MLLMPNGKRHHLPLELQKVLIAKQSNYTHLAKAMERRGYPITKQFLSQIGKGIRPAPVVQLKRICETLGCDELERLMLHRAACKDQGYEI